VICNLYNCTSINIYVIHFTHHLHYISICGMFNYVYTIECNSYIILILSNIYYVPDEA